ncbi:MAG: ATPase [Verrucomicrobiota bacterium]|nr:ATPase [Verrucomicrobiota bacterium]
MKIGVDGGGTKTECILVDAAGSIVARHTAPGTNPSVVGFENAGEVFQDALHALLAHSTIRNLKSKIGETRLFMAGSQSFWQEQTAGLRDFGAVTVAPDSLPVLELATDGEPGLVLHAGTGSFVAARSLDGTVRYAGGFGWRLGDPASGYEIARRAVARAILELQGWAPPSRLAAVVRDAVQADDAGGVTRFFYEQAEATREIASLAPDVLRLAAEDDPAALEITLDACLPLLDLARQVAQKLFADIPPDQLRAGLTGPILTHPKIAGALMPRVPWKLSVITAPPIEGVRRLLARG